MFEADFEAEACLAVSDTALFASLQIFQALRLIRVFRTLQN